MPRPAKRISPLRGIGQSKTSSRPICTSCSWASTRDCGRARRASTSPARATVSGVRIHEAGLTPRPLGAPAISASCSTTASASPISWRDTTAAAARAQSRRRSARAAGPLITQGRAVPAAQRSPSSACRRYRIAFDRPKASVGRQQRTIGDSRGLGAAKSERTECALPTAATGRRVRVSSRDPKPTQSRTETLRRPARSARPPRGGRDGRCSRTGRRGCRGRPREWSRRKPA